ncbi:hypothetical protein HQO84_24265 [Rhodococcus fascians]|uniref:hypothetical protein n=1 Tax=Nocardiaceae TaxID=85025 RepID=UPI00069E6620|nr:MULTISPECIES: hypothetical protein [Rhodococcus]KQU45947.1 hypothetical protein ASG84_11035 [Rhodococcus sp. Leaf278]MBX5333328.1 hypothetical protein [Rhodococcus fascians]MBY3989221.1 hypothetical protein [Rhodococcus fascians]MBY3998964.1 hypothetical protein [Rhodococcus fascians]MBY4004768.1 hypothetical protein [Rhodococcus fascians]
MSPERSATPPSGYRYEWSLFADWCAATDVEPLPASAMTLAQFLTGNPASDPVQLRRVAAINRRHLDAGHTPPGRAAALRMALDSGRTARVARRAEHYRELATALPFLGSTQALFGRRDAVLLLLSGAGLSHRAIASLDRSDIAVDGDGVWIDGRHSIWIAADESEGFNPAEIWERWRTVLRFSDRYPSTALLTEHVQGDTFPDMSRWPVRPGPVAVPIDRWGHMPFPADPMTPAAVGAVIAAHRSGRPPRHDPRPPLSWRRGRGERETDVTVPPPHPVSAAPGSDYYRIGVEARGRAHAALADVPDLVDDLEYRIEALMHRTLELLDIEPDAEAPIEWVGEQ